MGALTEDGLQELIAAGCKACGAKKLNFRAYVDLRMPLLGGEPDGRFTWIYDGEKFIDGVFEVRCAACQGEVFSSSICPRCNVEGGLKVALESENALVAPKECGSCQSEEVICLALVPARVTYEGQRAEKARTNTELFDPGFHAYEASCAFCKASLAKEDRCPLCRKEGPLRERP